MTAPQPVRLTEDQFWALERWIRSIARQEALPAFDAPENVRAIRLTAFAALVGRAPPADKPIGEK